MVQALRGVFYLDAGTGSMLVQLVVAGVAGVAVFAKLFWARVTSPFRRKPAEPSPDEGSGSDERAPERAQ